MNYQPPYIPPPMRVKYEDVGIALIVIGSVLIGIAIMIMGLIPGDIYAGQGTSSGGEYHLAIRINSLTIGVILAGIGVILEGLGSAFEIKAHFEQREFLSRK